MRDAIQPIDSAAPAGCSVDRQAVLQMLDEALATEIVCVLRCRQHYFMAGAAVGDDVKRELLLHAAQEQAHADQIAERIMQLGGEPDFNPQGICDRSHSGYVEGETLAEMVHEDLEAERIVIQSYTRMIHHIGDADPVTRQMLEGILANEKEHAEELENMIRVLR